MDLSSTSDYAIRAILHLSRHYEDKDVIPLTEISGSRNIPLKYLEQIMLILKGAGYVASKRGIKGGFFLVKPPDLIPLGEIITLMKGSLSRANPGIGQGTPHEPDEEAVAIGEVWEKVNEAVSNILDNVSFRDILMRIQEIREEKMGYMYEI